MADRRCIVCNETQSTQVFSKPYNLTGLGEVPMEIHVCERCGAVFQNPLPDLEKIRTTYRDMSNYTNPGRSGKPSATKINAVERQLDYLSQHVDTKGSAFQVGCSDGYTLHRFQKAGWEVDGIDPSTSAIALAHKQYNLTLHNGFIEDYIHDGTLYDLIILTHVLEHFVDPASVLQTCKKMLKADGFIFIEVPSLIDQSSWPTGYFTFEHLNYFSPVSMLNLMSQCGIEPVSPVATDFDIKDPYPIQMCIGKKSEQNLTIEKDKTALNMCCTYVERDQSLWHEINNKIKNATNLAERICIWGAGVHTAQLLKETELLTLNKPIMMVDIDRQKWGKQQNGIQVCSPDEIAIEDPRLTIIISSFVFEQEIKQTLLNKPSLAATVLTLYS
ncbi:class I SAM-dependent methyltransferase [Shewanella waksmanii]|uniref:class I SAM-dependent methyltransferase n=1 Tax=Shewanella waksmanii TaxID=213783 RepID=UPI0004B0FAB1|nr:class I SAM-dependent methyltransferase [Shewanella waksmanii]